MSYPLLKFIGALLLTAAGLYTGVLTAGENKRRIEAMRSLCTALDLLRGELATRSCGLPELLRIVAGKSQGDAKLFFCALSASMTSLGEEAFSAIWENACDALKLPPEFLEILSGIGAALGRFDLSLQLTALDTALSELRSILQNAEERYPDQRRVSLALPAAVSALLAILLL